jgi:hypothetical protein
VIGERRHGQNIPSARVGRKAKGELSALVEAMQLYNRRESQKPPRNGDGNRLGRAHVTKSAPKTQQIRQICLSLALQNGTYFPDLRHIMGRSFARGVRVFPEEPIEPGPDLVWWMAIAAIMAALIFANIAILEWLVRIVEGPVQSFIAK